MADAGSQLLRDIDPACSHLAVDECVVAIVDFAVHLAYDHASFGVKIAPDIFIVGVFS